ncbi:acetyltransferase (GNAT) family protein [Aminobacter sp. AP02]|nr:acetyltransferase (GNAT) family protein [Aminobacter sp. AP02]
MPSIEIRRLSPGDEHLLDNVADDVFDEAVDPVRLAACLASPGHLLFVALDHGQGVAQAAAMVHRHPDKASELYVDEIGVSPAWQRRGIATRIMDALLLPGAKRVARRPGLAPNWTMSPPGRFTLHARRQQGRRKPSSCMSTISTETADRLGVECLCACPRGTRPGYKNPGARPGFLSCGSAPIRICRLGQTAHRWSSGRPRQQQSLRTCRNCRNRCSDTRTGRSGSR